jgi:hypothetical protein
MRGPWLALLLALAGCGPLGPLSGGALRGPVHEQAVTDWSFTADIQTVQLQTNPADPHSVNTWCVGIGDRLYVPTSMIRGPKSPSERDWVKNVAADPAVRIRIDGAVYERVAIRVSDPSEYDAARAALEQKYALDPAERDPEREIWIFRLEPRGA